MTLLTDAQVAEIAERAEKATAEPWDTLTGSVIRAVRGDLAVPLFRSETPISLYVKQRVSDKAVSQAFADEVNNTIFVAHAREDIPALLSDRAEHEAKLAELTRENEEMRAAFDVANAEGARLTVRIAALEAQVKVARNHALEEAAMIPAGFSTAQNYLPEGVDGGWLAIRDMDMARQIRALKGSEE